MGQLDFIRSNFVRFFPKLSGKHFTDVNADQYPLFVHSFLEKHSDQRI